MGFPLTAFRSAQPDFEVLTLAYFSRASLQHSFVNEPYRLSDKQHIMILDQRQVW